MKVKTFSRTLRILFALLIAVTALKILIVGYDIDEQYALSMSYRMVKGDFPGLYSLPVLSMLLFRLAKAYFYSTRALQGFRRTDCLYLFLLPAEAHVLSRIFQYAAVVFAPYDPVPGPLRRKGLPQMAFGSGLFPCPGSTLLSLHHPALSGMSLLYPTSQQDASFSGILFSCCP